MIRFPWNKRKRKSYNTTFTTSIVPAIADFPDRENKTKDILKWLIEIKAVKPELSECTWYNDQMGYAIDKGAKKLTENPKELPFKQNRNGLEIILKRTVFASGDYDVCVSKCPVCGKTKFFDKTVLNNFKIDGISKVSCEGCESDIEINDYDFSPNWAFSNLGFVFWEWKDFKPDFLKEFEIRLGCKVKVVECLSEDVD